MILLANRPRSEIVTRDVIGQILPGFNEVKALARQAGFGSVRKPHQRLSMPVFREDNKCRRQITRIHGAHHTPGCGSPWSPGDAAKVGIEQGPQNVDARPLLPGATGGKH